MFYTIGRTAAYEEVLDGPEPVLKAGRHVKDDGTPYCGGSVWKTISEALSHLPAAFSIYGVEGDWESMTEPSQDGPWHDLLEDRLIFRLSDEEIEAALPKPKPCPFCGSDKVSKSWDEYDQLCMTCDQCHAMGGTDDRNDRYHFGALELWNRRSMVE
jgi:hypothetical protein